MKPEVTVAVVNAVTAVLVAATASGCTKQLAPSTVTGASTTSTTTTTGAASSTSAVATTSTPATTRSGHSGATTVRPPGSGGAAPAQPPGGGGAAPAAGSASSTNGHAKVIINGQDQHFQGPVTCRTTSGFTFIQLGPIPTKTTVPPPAGTAQITMTAANPPSLTLATFNINGVIMFAGSSSGNGQVSAQGNSYKVTGNSGAGTDFEIDVAC